MTNSPPFDEQLPRDPERVIIYRLGSLGDTVAALPCFHLIERAFPAAERIVLTNHPVSSKAPPLEAILRPGGFIHGSIPYPLQLRDPRALRALCGTLRAQSTDTLIYLQARSWLAAWRDVAYFRTCGLRRTIGAPLTPDRSHNRVDRDGSVERETHRLVRNLASLGQVDLSDRSLWDLRLTQQEQSVATARLGQAATRPFLAVNTGGKSWQKDWGVEAWSQLLRLLGARLDGWELAFLGSREDHDRAAELGQRWPGAVIDLCGELTPRESAAVLQRASLFIGHDSGVLHLADAVGTPALGLFGNYNKPRMWHPSGPRTRIIHRMSGLRDIAPEEVADAAAELGSAVAGAV